MKSLVVHDPASGEAVFQVQKKDGGGYQGQMSLGKLENGENVDIQTKEVNGTLQVIADVTRPRTTSSSHNLTSTFRAAPVNGQSMLITTKRILHMDHPTIDPRYYTEKTISVLDDSMKIRVSNLTLHRIPKRSGQYIQSHAIAEIPNPIPNSKVIDVQIDANNKVVISALDQQGTLHTLNYKFVEELNRDLSAAKPSEALTNRARLVVDDSRPGTVVENAIKNGHLKAQVDAIPAPQKVSPTQNVNNINLPPMSVPTATQ
jgi:hypothetical protein